MSSGIEQLILFAFLGLVLLQLLIRWARSASARMQAAAPRGPREQVDRQLDERQPAWPPPVRIAAAPAARPRPMAASTTTAPPGQVAPRPGTRSDAAAAARALRHGNRAALRRAFVLTTVLGPPRALDDDR